LPELFVPVIGESKTMFAVAIVRVCYVEAVQED
jgi:hypothetical protein